jgi:hypothetical protein
VARQREALGRELSGAVKQLARGARAAQRGRSGVIRAAFDLDTVGIMAGVARRSLRAAAGPAARSAGDADAGAKKPSAPLRMRRPGVAFRVGGPDREAGGLMTVTEGLLLALSVVTFVYLAIAMFRPERF